MSNTEWVAIVAVELECLGFDKINARYEAENRWYELSMSNNPLSVDPVKYAQDLSQEWAQ